MSRLLVTQYQAEVEKIICYGGSRKETSIRNAFERLLNDYCKPRNYLLIPELDFKTRLNTTVIPDGTIKDAIRLEYGWWESKDQYDRLGEEIEKKFEQGYPDENILFEDSQTAVLIQHRQEVARVAMQDADGLDHLLNFFVDYERPVQIRRLQRSRYRLTPTGLHCQHPHHGNHPANARYRRPPGKIKIKQ